MASATFTTQSSSIQKTLPCFPGYAMGGIILTAKLEVPYLMQEMSNIEDQIQRIKVQQIKLAEDSAPSKEEAQKKMKQRKWDALQFQEDELKSDQKRIEEKIESFKEAIKQHPPFETMLPIDYQQSRFECQHRSDESENMHFIIFKQDSAPEQINSFTEHLTKMSYLPTVLDLINQVSETILKQPKHNQEICLLGSFVTLTHVRVMDPIVLRKEAVLSELVESAAKYSVISESVLGGVFIGFGNKVSTPQDEEPSSKSDMEATASRVHIFSFVSQGAIPSTDHANLWDTYNNWKKKLTSNPNCGFPIAFKVRKLTDVLQENEMLPLKKEEK